MKTREEVLKAFLDYDYSDLAKYIYNYAIIPTEYKVVSSGYKGEGMGVFKTGSYGYVSTIFEDIAEWKAFVGEHFDGIWELHESIDDCLVIDFIDGFVFFAFSSLGIFQKLDEALGWSLDYSLWSNYYFSYTPRRNEDE